MEKSVAADPFDVAVGERVRAFRKAKGISQTTLAEACGISFQQVQKYENGNNRISASMLSRIAVFLNCRMAFLLGEDGAADVTTYQFLQLTPLAHRAAMSFDKIADPAVRKDLARLIARLAGVIYDDD